ncbi:hypothetical protein B0J14DRAFT_656150 [Halenospora varia]|nr:hypothetical protein B0J14DRAFT_656150 [Halenospora varia]
MDLSEQMLEETSEPAEKLPPEGQERSCHAAQRIQTAQPSHSGARPTQSPQDRYGKPSEARQKAIRTSGGARHTQARNQEASGGAQASNMTPSTANWAQNEYQEDANLEPRGTVPLSSIIETAIDRIDPRRTLSTPANESEYTFTSNLEQFQILKQQYANLEQHYRLLKSQHEQALHHIQKETQTMNSLKVSLEESEAQRANFQQRLEEASNTIFRLLPQRQEYTESEIEEDYERLVKVVKNWVSINCESFVDDDVQGFDALGRCRLPPGDHLEAFEDVILRFQSQSIRWIDAKEHVLVAAVMRYLYERILNQPFSILLLPEERNFLANIQIGMEDTRLQNDLLTVRTWRSDTIAAIDSHENFVNRHPLIEDRLTSDLCDFLGAALSGQDSESTISSLHKEIIAPTITLAHKTQSSSSIWHFRYSDFLAHKPGEFGSRIPNFLSNIQEFRCINMSNRDRFLKPANELTTREEKESLLYVLDIFPGLYCQRVTAGDSLPLSTVNRPILLVAFASKENHTHKQQGLSEPVDPDKTNQNRTKSPSRPVSTSRGRGFIDSVKTKLGLSE